MDKIPMTAEGFRALEAELKTLKTVRRPSVIKAIAAAREHGDLSENAEYHAAKEEQTIIEARVAEVEEKVSTAEIIDFSELSGDTVKFGATISLIDVETDEEQKFQIVGADEADVKSGKISNTSPVARALIGKSVGDEVEVNAPGGQRALEILSIEFV